MDAVEICFGTKLRKFTTFISETQVPLEKMTIDRYPFLYLWVVMNSLEENQKPKTPTMSSEPPAVKILQNYAELDVYSFQHWNTVASHAVGLLVVGGVEEHVRARIAQLKRFKKPCVWV
jgi:hypothetical protein